jgi:RNA polymerase sigma factor (sigma-70 family)
VGRQLGVFPRFSDPTSDSVGTIPHGIDTSNFSGLIGPPPYINLLISGHVGKAHGGTDMETEKRAAVRRQVQSLFNVGAIGGLSDGQLLERFSARNGEAAELAFAALVERHGPCVLRTCRAILRDPSDAHDAFQATFLVLVRRAGSLWVRESLGAWLYAVAYRTASCARIAAARRRKHERKASEYAATSSRFEGGDDLREILHDELNRLPERFRAAVMLCLVEGLTHEQAARRLGWPLGTVESRLARGRARLRARLTRRGLVPTISTIAAAFAVNPAQSAVPANLAESTTRAALRLAADKAVVAEVVSASVLALVEGGSRTMILTKLKLAGAVLLTLGVTSTGAGLWASQKGRTGDQPANETVRPPEKSSGIVARVQGIPLTREQLMERCLTKYGKQELESLVNEVIIQEAAKRRGVSVSDADVLAEAARVARDAGISLEQLYETLNKQRAMSKDQYLRDVIYPNLMLRKIADGADVGALFEDLKRKSDVQIFFPPATERQVDKTSDRPRSSDQRLQDVERKLDQTLKALDGLRGREGR